MNYTKGPWVYSKHRDTHDCVIHQANAIEKYGYIHHGEGGVVGSSEWIWIDDMDGYLIAAAPELYEALKKLCSQVNDLDLCSAPQYALDAIAKAEGRNND